MNILVLNGPNLNLLGEREPDVYGSVSYKDVVGRVTDYASDKGVNVTCKQSNCQGQLIDFIHDARNDHDGLIINPGAYASSHAIADAIRSTSLSAVEVHLTNVYARESWRGESAISPACVGYICGFGWHGYLLAIDGLLSYLNDRKNASPSR